MTDKNIFNLIGIIKTAKGDPYAMVDAIWDAGYRQPERNAGEAAKLAIDTLFYCNSFDMPTDFWPRDYDSVLQNELMKAVIGENGELDGADATTIAHSVISAGFSKQQAVNKDAIVSTLNITLPDISSKAFWSRDGKTEVFHPETYKRWVKEAIERDCLIAKLDVEVK